MNNHYKADLETVLNWEQKDKNPIAQNDAHLKALKNLNFLDADW